MENNQITKQGNNETTTTDFGRKIVRFLGVYPFSGFSQFKFTFVFQCENGLFYLVTPGENQEVSAIYAFNKLAVRPISYFEKYNMNLAKEVKEELESAKRKIMTTKAISEGLLGLSKKDSDRIKELINTKDEPKIGILMQERAYRRFMNDSDEILENFRTDNGIWTKPELKGFMMAYKKRFGHFPKDMKARVGTVEKPIID